MAWLCMIDLQRFGIPMFLFTKTFHSFLFSIFVFLFIRILVALLHLSWLPNLNQHSLLPDFLFDVVIVASYLAPEYALEGRLTRRADVYSFGVLLLEIVSGRSNINTRLPYEDQFLLERVWQISPPMFIPSIFVCVIYNVYIGALAFPFCFKCAFNFRYLLLCSFILCSLM